MSNVDDFLEHYGVKGMRWGVRTRSGGKGTKGYSKDAKAAVRVRNKAKTSDVKVKALSNREIEDFLKRVSLESRFREATPGPGKRAMNTVRTILGVGKTMNEVASFSNTPTGKQLRSSFEKPTPKTSQPKASKSKNGSSSSGYL